LPPTVVPAPAVQPAAPPVVIPGDACAPNAACPCNGGCTQGSCAATNATDTEDATAKRHHPLLRIGERAVVGTAKVGRFVIGHHRRAARRAGRGGGCGCE
jgi:hypothetical protein